MRYRRTLDPLKRKFLVLSMGFCRLVSKLELNLPSKWISLLESVRTSANIVYGKLSSIDSEASEEVVKKENMIERRFGERKFYSEEDLEELSNKKGSISI